MELYGKYKVESYGHCKKRYASTIFVFWFWSHLFHLRVSSTL